MKKASIVKMDLPRCSGRGYSEVRSHSNPKRQNPSRRGYSKRNLYNMVRFYDVYSSTDYLQLIDNLKISDFVQSQTAQIASRPIVQMPSAQFQDGQILEVLRTRVIAKNNTISERLE